MAASLSPVQLAAWIPGWYNLDHSLAVGQVAEFAVYARLPDLSSQRWLVDVPDLVFFNSVMRPDEWSWRRLRVVSIRNPALGWLTAISTERFGVYEFTSVEGRTYEVEAEEGPGVCYDSTVSVSEWGAVVEVVEETTSADQARP